MLGRIARQLAGQAARQLASNAVSSAKSQHAAAQTKAPVEPALGVLFALKLEAAPTWERMDAATPCQVAKLMANAGRLGSQFCVAAVGGVGRAATERAAKKLLAIKPKLVVSAGLAVAQDERLRHGDILFANRVCTAQGSWAPATQFAPTSDMLPIAEDMAVRVHQGALLTTEQIVRSPAQRRELAETHDVLACDLESAWLAAACAEADVPWLAVRVVCDEVDDELPPDVATIREQSNSASRMGATAGALFREPGRALDLWKLRQAAAEAANHLAGAMVELFRPTE